MALRIAPFAGVGAALGVLSHLCYFMHGEHHRDSMHILQISIALPSIAFLALTQIYPAFFAWKLVTIVFASFVGSLWTSMLVYRAFFHRLHSYPGPFMAKLTKMWHVSILTHFDSYKQLDKLHSKYGEYVRIGKFRLLNGDVFAEIQALPSFPSSILPLWNQSLALVPRAQRLHGMTWASRSCLCTNAAIEVSTTSDVERGIEDSVRKVRRKLCCFPD